MAGKKLQIHTQKEVVCGTGFAIQTKTLTALEPGVTLNEDSTQGITVGSKSVILESERESVLIKHEDGKLVNYTVAVTITRDPITDAERSAVAAYAAKGTARKAAQTEKEERLKLEIAKRNYELGKDGISSGLAAAAQVIPALSQLGLTVAPKTN